MSLSRITVAAAICAALAASAPARAAPPVAAPPGGEGCSPMMARWQSDEARYSALGDADLGAYNDVQNDIDRAAHFCEAGQDAEAKAIMDASRERHRLPM